MNDDEKKAEPEQDESTAWWNTTPLGTARRKFRETLKDPHSRADEIGWAWLRYYGVANMHGTTRAPALVFPDLMLHRQNPSEFPLWERISRDALPGMVLIGFRATIALSEFSEVPLATLDRARDCTCRLASRAGVDESDFAFLRLALSIRLGTHSAYESDYLAVRNSWRAKKDDERTTLGCESGRAAILVEWLLHEGREHEAIELADEAAASDPCVGPCGIAPQTMLALLLAPMSRVAPEKVRPTMQRLSACAPTSRTWLLPAGCLIAAHARFGDFDSALAIAEKCNPFASDAEISDWHKFHFHSGLAELQSHGSNLVTDDPEDHRSIAQGLRLSISAQSR